MQTYVFCDSRGTLSQEVDVPIYRPMRSIINLLKVTYETLDLTETHHGVRLGDGPLRLPGELRPPYNRLLPKHSNLP
jgi:hypothetical protein